MKYRILGVIIIADTIAIGCVDFLLSVIFTDTGIGFERFFQSAECVSNINQVRLVKKSLSF